MTGACATEVLSSQIPRNHNRQSQLGLAWDWHKKKCPFSLGPSRDRSRFTPSYARVTPSVRLTCHVGTPLGTPLALTTTYCSCTYVTVCTVPLLCAVTVTVLLLVTSALRASLQRLVCGTRDLKKHFFTAEEHLIIILRLLVRAFALSPSRHVGEHSSCALSGVRWL